MVQGVLGYQSGRSCLTSDIAQGGTGYLMGAVPCHPALCRSPGSPGAYQTALDSCTCSTKSNPGADRSVSLYY